MLRGVAVALILLAVACRPPATPVVAAPRAGVVSSNITRADYAGSRSCQPCHAEIWNDWSRSPMHNMTRQLDQATVQAPFAGETWRFKRDTITFETHDQARWMRLDSATDGTHTYRVTKVIGGHHREDFVGLDEKNVQRILPATYVPAAHGWRYKGYSVMTPERPGLRPGAVWSKTCIFCHNTEPYLSDLFGTLAGPGTPPYQGAVIDGMLPDARRWTYRITDEPALARAVDREIAFLGAGGSGLAQAVKATRARFDEQHLVEIGIGCESCHGGSAEHVRTPEVRPSLVPRAPFLAVEPAVRSRANEINHACARCHQVLFSQYAWTWEGEKRNSAHPGGAHINSGESRDFLMGGCAGEMSCVACHDPHAHDNREKMAILDGPKGSETCMRCHPARYATREHTHHDPAGAGGQCMSCHMPKKNMSLDNGLSRYHRIASPTDRAKVEGDRPLECALCHADKSVGELVDVMESWWNKKYDRQKLEQLYGSLRANVVRATVAMGKPHEQATALALLSERSAAPLAAVQLTHGIPIVRYYAERALATLLARPITIDLFQDNEAIRAQASALLREAGLAPLSPTPGPAAGPTSPAAPPASPAQIEE